MTGVLVLWVMIMFVGVVAVGSDTSLDNTREHLNSKSGDNQDFYDCRERYSNLYFENEEGETGSFRCGSWRCYCCAHRMRYNMIREVRRLAKEKGLDRFLTLTLDPKKLPSDCDKFEYIMKRWNKFRIYLNRTFGETSFVWVLELQENGNPHLHALISRYVPQTWVSRTWAGMGGGKIVDIQQADVQRVGNYLSKYLAGGSLMELPKGVNRYGYSSGSIEFRIRSDGSGEGDWSLKVRTPTCLQNGVCLIVREVKRVDFVNPPPDIDEIDDELMEVLKDG